jgi:hypothetical protein
LIINGILSERTVALINGNSFYAKLIAGTELFDAMEKRCSELP